jgi:hypothetical protein
MRFNNCTAERSVNSVHTANNFVCLRIIFKCWSIGEKPML